MTTGRVGGGREGGAAVVEGWLLAVAKAAVLLALSVVGFAFVPNWLVNYLSLHVAPRTRDALVTLWTVAWFVALSWLFVAAQRLWRE